MIGIGTRVSGFDGRSWYRLATLVAPGLASRAPHEFDARAADDGGTLLIMYEDSRILRAVHTHHGVIEVDRWPGVQELGNLASRHRASFALAAESGALEELLERIGSRVRMDDDATTTTLVILSAVRELYDEGALHMWPRLLPERIPLPTPAVIQRTFDFVLPDDGVALVALFEGDALDTAIFVHRRGDVIDRVHGPETLMQIVGPLGGDFHRDHHVIRRAIERDVGPLAFGLFTETATLRELLRSTRPGAWAQSMALRDVILDPMPAWLAVAAGAGAVRAAALRSRALMTGLSLLGSVTPSFSRVRKLAGEVTGLDIEQLLGFNPMHVLAQILRRSSSTDRDE